MALAIRVQVTVICLQLVFVACTWVHLLIMSMSKIAPAAMVEAPVAPAPDYDTVVKEEVNNSPKSRQSLKRAGTKYFGVGTLLMVGLILFMMH